MRMRQELVSGRSVRGSALSGNADQAGCRLWFLLHGVSRNAAVMLQLFRKMRINMRIIGAQDGEVSRQAGGVAWVNRGAHWRANPDQAVSFSPLGAFSLFACTGVVFGALFQVALFVALLVSGRLNMEFAC